MSWFFWWGLSEFGMALDKYYYVGVCETWSFVSDIFCDYMGLMPFSFGEVDVFLKKKNTLESTVETPGMFKRFAPNYGRG